MDKVFEKLSDYNIFTNFSPGIVYCFLVEKFFAISLIQDDLVVGAFIYCFCGMVIFRISSVVIEPLLKNVRFVTFVDYKKDLSALAKDERIVVLLEANNSYRSAAALLVCVMATGGWVAAAPSFPSIVPYIHYIFLACLLVLFLFAYRKQTQYIVARAELNENKSETFS